MAFPLAAHAANYNDSFFSRCIPFTISTPENVFNTTHKIILSSSQINYSLAANPNGVRITNSSNCDFKAGDIESSQYVFNWTSGASVVYMKTVGTSLNYSIWYGGTTLSLKADNNTFLIYDDFERADGQDVGFALTGQLWDEISTERCVIKDHSMWATGSGDAVSTCWASNTFVSTNNIVSEVQTKINQTPAEFKYQGLNENGNQRAVMSFGIGANSVVAYFSGAFNSIGDTFASNEWKNFTIRYNQSSNTVSYFDGNNYTAENVTGGSGGQINRWAITNGGGASAIRNVTIDNLRVYASTYQPASFVFGSTAQFNDTTAPVVVVQSPTGNLSSMNITLSFTATDAFGIDTASCKYSLDNAVNVTITGCQNTTFSASQGNHTLKVFASDMAGNVGQGNASFQIVDITAPVVTIISPTGQQTSSNVTITFTASDSSPITCVYRVDGGSNTSLTGCANSSFTSAQGAHNFTVCATDGLNTGCANSTYTLDSIAPVITITLPISAQYPQGITSVNLTLNYTLTESGSGINSTRCVRSTDGAANVTLTSCGNATLSFAVPSTHSIKIYAFDNFGNAGFATITFAFTNTPPVTGTNATILNLFPILLSIALLFVGIGVMFQAGRSGNAGMFAQGATILVVGMVLLILLTQFVANSTL